jgi:hypothetical protein
LPLPLHKSNSFFGAGLTLAGGGGDGVGDPFVADFSAGTVLGGGDGGSGVGNIGTVLTGLTSEGNGGTQRSANLLGSINGGRLEGIEPMTTAASNPSASAPPNTNATLATSLTTH